mgnify:CR=1 FL=1
MCLFTCPLYNADVRLHKSYTNCMISFDQSVYLIVGKFLPLPSKLVSTPSHEVHEIDSLVHIMGKEMNNLVVGHVQQPV